ncbi:MULTISPECIES: 4Fe-4S dicluster domain-containing protein [unclassified Spirosoma]|uniref:4Fe-4S dicluster domain-containing protein n=1 Tax=unclassified Spirosoma TaxID=2621999 RepID=UPI0009653CA6|nr:MULTISPECIES: 4Fe-4S dicluster domain-containing protein [unclassified Spirosoma]MBN8824613.1 4Fe-4S dicluster domain-containing protein [Spirosoma sp.]OJW78832.1 MAG: 4Fe-4S ferredoxin [Spirosoma sp. 48-14]
MSYFHDIQTGIRTTLKGLSLTLKHLRRATKRRTPEGIASDNYFDLQNGLVTLQYPHEQLPIPDNGRYRLRNEIEDCIVCDKCAKVCPVDCITIDAIKATEEVGRASDGSPIRLYAAKFDIDMAKCCYCGLCTVVCPTECLTMDKKFDYSEFELGKLTYNFSNLTPEQADEKRSLYEQFLREKEEAKAAQKTAKPAIAPASESATAPTATAPKRPVFRPTAKPAAPATDKPVNSEGSSIEHPLTDAKPDEMQQIAQEELETAKRPVFKPTQKPIKSVVEDTGEAKPAGEKLVDTKPVVAKPAFRPTMKPGKAEATKSIEPDAIEPANSEAVTPKPSTKPPGFRPTMKPTVGKTAEPEKPASEANVSEPVQPKPAGFRPTMKPANPAKPAPDPDPTAQPTEAAKPKPGFRPTMKPKPAPEGEAGGQVDLTAKSEASDEAKPAELTGAIQEAAKPKPAFRPTMKPKPKPDEGESTN